MIRRFLIHLLFMLLGYVLAVLTATTIAVTIGGAPTVFPDQGAWGSFYKYMRDFPMMFSFGLYTTSIWALPGWLLTVVYAELRGQEGRLFFGVAGALTAVLAIFLAGNGRGLFSDMLINPCPVGGFFGGLVYWAVAGRSSGQWRNPAKPYAQDNPAAEGAPK
jgi:hypothetical protein